MARGRTGQLKAGGSGQKQRAAYYEDYAKPVIVNWPFMLVAAATLLVVGHFANRGSGRRLGGEKKRSPSTKRSSSRSGSSNDREEGTLGCQGIQPLRLDELRVLHAQAAEARLTCGATTNGAATPIPLGAILLLAQKVDKLEEETSLFLDTVKDGDRLDLKREKEHLRLLELLTRVQLEIDGLQSDENVRPHRKSQTNRIQHLILDLEGINKETS